MLRRNWKIFFVGLSQVVDVTTIGLTAAFCYGLHAAGFLIFEAKLHLAVGLGIFLVTYMTTSSLMGLYRGSFHLSLRLQFLIVARSFVISVMITLAVISLVKEFYIDRREVFVFVITLPVLLFLGRVSLRRLNLRFQKKGYGVHNSLIVGFDEQPLKFAERFSTFPELGYQIKGFVVNGHSNGETAAAGRTLFNMDRLDEVIERYRIDRIFIPSADFIVDGHHHLKESSKRFNVKLKVLSPHAEDLLKIARVYDIAGITLVSPPRYNVDFVKRFLKRGFDIVGSLLIILLLSPVFLITIVAIFVESGRPIFFLQKRAALKGGQEFDFIKFRSMVANAEDLKESLWEKNETDGALFKMKDDPRITAVGRFIRKFSIDELPQLFNVLVGDMSLVGPRPLPIDDFDEVQESDEFWDAIKDRALLKPGMTGLWQISGRSEIRFKDMILLDLYYVENYSLLFDVEILFETIPVVLFGRGAY